MDVIRLSRGGMVSSTMIAGAASAGAAAARAAAGAIAARAATSGESRIGGDVGSSTMVATSGEEYCLAGERTCFSL